MKKILFFTDTPIAGGAELQMFLLAKFLKSEKYPEKYEISLSCLSNPSLDSWCGKFKDTGIKVFRIPSSYKNHPKIFSSLRKILKKENTDLLHIHLWNPASGRYAFLAARIADIPYVVTEHDPFRLNPLKRGLKRLLMRQPKATIAISKENKSFLEREYENVLHIPNGIDTDFWQTELASLTDKDRENIRKSFGASEKDFVILNVAALHERKGQETLLKAFALLKKHKTNLRLVLSGEGEHRKKFEDLAEELGIQESTKFLGHRNDVPKLLFAADLFSLPSHREGFGLALLEAGMAKLPAVASKVGGILDIIEDGKDGVLVAPKDHKALADAIAALMEDGEKRVLLGSKLHEKVIRTFDASSMAEKTGALYDKIFV